MAKVFEQAGDLGPRRFEKWWNATGTRLFVEAERPFRLRRIDDPGMEAQVLYPAGKSMLIEVPLTVTSRTLIKQFKEVLAQAHDGQRVDVLEHSTAIWRLHTKRYNLQTIENEFWVTVYKLIYPDIASWRIGDRLQISPGVNLRGIRPERYLGRSTPITRMQSTVGRYLYKGQRTVWNAELGRFPDSGPCSITDKPFGQKHHMEYLAATRGTLSEPSPWQLWLRQQYRSQLAELIKEKNHITGLTAVDPKVMMRLPRFIAGESDLLS